MSKQIFAADNLTGGTPGCLDDIHHTSITDGNLAVVISETKAVYFYRYEESSSAAENSPYVISPDSNLSDGRWILQIDNQLTVDAVSDLQSFPQTPVGSITTLGFYEAGDGGGGTFYWDSNESQSNHNGGTIIDPDHSATPGATAWYTAENAGLGCWVKTDGDTTNVKAFGAKVDGAVNDTTALQSVIDACSAAGGGVIRLPSGTMAISPPIVGGSIFTAASNVHIDGGSTATLKVANSSGAYTAIFFGASGSDCSNFGINGVTFDHNITNNAPASYTELETSYRCTVLIYNGSDCFFNNNIVKNEKSINTVVFNGVNVFRPVVRGNKFVDIGADPGLIYGDHSTIYIHTMDTSGISSCAVQDNEFYAATGAWAQTARTAIETHASRTLISGNRIEGYVNGIFATGVSSGDNEAIIVQNNVIDVILNGILLWSVQYSTHTTGYGLDGVLVGNNLIRVRQTQYSGANATLAVGFWPNNTLDSRGITIKNNTIYFDPQDTTGYNEISISAAIAIHGASGYESAKIEGLLIEDNYIYNSPFAAIRLSGYVLENPIVINNMIINAGQSLDTATADAYKIPIFFLPSDLIGSALVKGNYILDSFTVSRTISFVYIGANVDVSDHDILFIDNTYILSGSDTSSLGRHHSIISGGLVLPFIKDRVSHVVYLPAISCKAGSSIYNYTNDQNNILKADGIAWHYLRKAAAMPTTGSWTAGSEVENTSWSVLGSGGYGTSNQRYVIKRWLRMTTGSGHTLNTDWVEERVLTGT